MSEFANKVKTYYDRGMWNLKRVDKALKLEKISQDEYDLIVGNTGEQLVTALPTFSESFQLSVALASSGICHNEIPNKMTLYFLQYHFLKLQV